MKDKQNKTDDALNSQKEESSDSSRTKQEMKKPAKDKIIKIKESEYKKLVAEAEEYKDKHIRLYAEFDNVRKRTQREKIEFVKYANEGLIVEFLNILDDLERSIDAAKAKHQDYEAFLKGIEMVMAHIYDLLKKNDVRPVEAKGKKFDPHCHEALLQEENGDVQEDVVLEELQKGYFLGDRVVRTSKVKLSKAPAVSDNSSEE